jgi:hypothetical protein
VARVASQRDRKERLRALAAEGYADEIIEDPRD